MPSMRNGFEKVNVVRVREAGRSVDVDCAATEEPLEVRLHGRPFAVIMRTPGADRELAAGFLLAERVIASADDLGTIEHCTDAGAEHPENVVNVTLANGSAGALEQVLAGRRLVAMTSSCGMCGRLSIDSLRTGAPPLQCGWRVSRAVLSAMPGRLRAAQMVFDETGGLHAAGLFTRDGALDSSAEDVGRHNAVDKVIGRMVMRDAIPLADRLLFVSGRTSFEIVQKAVLAGIPIVGSVSAPSSLAISLAEDAGVTLAGFVRGGRFNIYSHPSRIEG
jgi:FdhD protein